MAQGPSKAQTSHREALKRATALMDAEKAFDDPPDYEVVPVVEGLRGGAIVLMVAAFEAFLRDLFTERVDLLATERPEVFASLPDSFRIAAVYNPLEHAMRFTPGVAVAAQKVDRIESIQKVARSVASKTLIPESFGVTASSASSRTVARLFKEVGRSNVFDASHDRFEKNWGAPLARGTPAKVLDDLIEARHDVAHGSAVTIAWSREDMKNWLRHMRVLAKTLDDDLRIHLNSVGRESSS